MKKFKPSFKNNYNIFHFSSKMIFHLFKIFIKLAIPLIIVFFTLYHFKYIKKGEILYNNTIGQFKRTSNGLVLVENLSKTKDGFKFNHYVKATDEPQFFSGHCLLQTKDAEVKILKFIIVYDYDYNWINKYKKIPPIVKIPPYAFEEYMIDKFIHYSAKEMINRRLLEKAVRSFYKSYISQNGYRVLDCIIPAPLLNYNSTSVIDISFKPLLKK